MPGGSIATILLCTVAAVACQSTPANVAVLPSPSVTSPPATASGTPTQTTSPTRTPSAPASSTSMPTGVPEWLRGAPVTRLPTSRRVVALTFDGGAGAQGATTVVSALARAGVPATFFLTGQFVRSYPQVVASLTAQHYVIGNHTMTHPHLTKLASAAVVEEIADAQMRLAAATGVDPRPLFRFPYGEYDARTLNLVHSLGYGAVGWTVDTRGWQGSSAGTVDDVVRRVQVALRPGAIVLMHLGANPDDGTTFDALALPRVIALIRAAGYTFTTLLDW